MAPNMAASTSLYSTVHANLIIFVSILSFLGTSNTFRLNEYLYSLQVILYTRSHVLTNLATEIERKKSEVVQNSKTSQLWLN